MESQELAAIIKIVSLVDWSAWVTAIATLILASLTFVYVRLTKRILESQSDPFVIVSVVHDNDRTTVLQLVARNIGKGLAHDIRFDFSKPLPGRAWGLSKDQAKDASPMEDGPLILGIPALGPGEERKIDWGQYGGLINCLGEEPIKVTVHFKKNGREMSPVTNYLDIKSFEGTNASESPISKVAKNIEKLSKDVHALTNGFYKPQIRVVELPEHVLDDENQS